MQKNLKDLILIKEGASRKKVYRFNKKNSKFILLDFSEDANEFNNHLNVYNILKNIDISVPKIFEVNFKDKIIVTEDFGDQRFDKVFNKYDINSLIECAIESLIIINNSTINSISTNNLSKYNYDTFKNEISEFIEFFIPYKKIDNSLNVAFFETWKEHYYNSCHHRIDSINLSTDDIVEKIIKILK